MKKHEASKRIESRILLIRGRRVMLDAHPDEFYGFPTKALNQAVKRNAERFPPDFVFRLTRQEDDGNRSQIVTGSRKHRDPRFPPIAFTEHGVIMAANVLNSPRAVQMSVFVVRAFVRMREQLPARSGMEKRSSEIEKVLLSHDAALRDLYAKIRPLLRPPMSRPRTKGSASASRTCGPYTGREGE